MKTWVKILLIAALAVVAIKIWPLAIVLVGIAGLVFLAASGVLAGGVLVALISAIGMVIGLLALGVTCAVVLSPIWLVALAVFGIVALVRRANARST